MSTPLSPERLARAQEIGDRASDPFFVEDCEGSLQVWRESALVRVARDEGGEIVSWATPSAYRPSDLVVEIELERWDPGEDAEDDVRRTDIRDLVDGRALIPDLLAEVERLRAEVELLLAEMELLRAEVKSLEAYVDEYHIFDDPPVALEVSRSNGKLRTENADLRREMARLCRERAEVLREAAGFVRDAHFADGMSVQEIGTALGHMADDAERGGACGVDLGPGYTCQRPAGHDGDHEPTSDSGGAS